MILAVSGPALAFLLLMSGCEGVDPFFGEMCGHNVLPSLVMLSVLFWFVLAMASTLFTALRNKE